MTAYAQESTDITGIVTTFNRFPLNHVLVKSLKTGSTAQSDSLGHFLIKSTDKDNLQFSASGFNSKKIKIRKFQIISVDMTYANSETSFQDAVSNMHISAEDLHNAINSRAPKGTKDYSKYKNIFDLINSEVFAVKVVGTSVVSKRIQSFSLTSKVLFVLDDMVVADISTVLPSEVQSIEYLDGIKASIYGSSGANGVLKITLKGNQ